MSIPKAVSTKLYVLDMLGQLTQLARSDGLEGLARGIETVIVAERTAASLALTPTATAARDKRGSGPSEETPT